MEFDKFELDLWRFLQEYGSGQQKEYWFQSIGTDFKSQHRPKKGLLKIIKQSQLFEVYEDDGKAAVRLRNPDAVLYPEAEPSEPRPLPSGESPRTDSGKEHAEKSMDRSRSPRRTPRECDADRNNHGGEEPPRSRASLTAQLNPHRRALLVRLVREAKVAPCTPPFGKIECDLQWTDTPGDDRDICEPGEADERREFQRKHRPSKATKRKVVQQPLDERRLRWEAPASLGVSHEGFWGNSLTKPGRSDSDLCSSEPLLGLPVDQYRQAVLEMMDRHCVTIIEAQTGAGKSTRIPRFLLQNALLQSKPCCVAVGVPRRMAARELAKRVAQEAGEDELGQSVGLFTDEDRRPPCRTASVSFATFGSLLGRVRHGIRGCCTVILDEVHETSVELELLLLAVKEVLEYNKTIGTGRSLKVLLMSAAANFEQLKAFLGPAGHLRIPGRTFDVTWRFRDNWGVQVQGDPECQWPVLDAPAIAELVIHLLHREGGPGGHILVFLSGLSEMEIVEGHLRKLGNSATNTGPLQGAQLRIEKLHSSMRTSLERVRVSDAVVIYLSTNIAESSVTIDGLGVVIDYGVHKRREHFQLASVAVSKQNIRQRAGRAGRTSEGEYFALFTEKEYEKMSDFETPDILRVPLEGHVLGVLCDVSEVSPDVYLQKAMHPPGDTQVQDSLYKLRRLHLAGYSGYTGQWYSTSLGRRVKQLPLEVQWAVPLVLSTFVGLEREMADAVATATDGQRFSKKAKPSNRKQADEYQSELWSDVVLGELSSRSSKAVRLEDQVLCLLEGVKELRRWPPIPRTTTQQRWPAVRLLLAAGLRENVAVPSDTGSKFVTAWKRLKAATKNGSPGSWQSPMLFEQAFNHSLQGMMHIPIEDLMLFANKLCWRCGDKDPVKVNNNLLTATSSFYDASLLAASGVAIMKLADKWAGRKGYTSDTAVAALLRQFCTDVGHPLPPLRALPEPGQRDQECGLLANGMRGWCALRNAFEILHNALVPWTDNSETMWDTGIRALEKAWPACEGCRQDLKRFEKLLTGASPSTDWVCLLAEQLQPPRRHQTVSTELTRFTQASASLHIAHGRHRGLLCTDVARLLHDKFIQWDAAELRLDVVYWHGRYRSLNNRHLAVLKLAGAERCCVRLWPLTPGLNLPGSRNCVVRKFLKAQQSPCGGTTLTFVDRSLSRHAEPPETEASEGGVGGRAGEVAEAMPEYLTLSGRKGVTSHMGCWIGGTHFLTPTNELKPIESLQAGNQLCAANGQVVNILRAERLPKQERELVHMIATDRMDLGSLASPSIELRVTSDHKVMAEVRKQFQAIAAGKLVEGDRVLISGSLPSRLISVTRALEEAECYRLELDPDLPVESFHRPAGILTKGQQPHRRGGGGTVGLKSGNKSGTRQ
ncbi:putative ATP-dependent RNA helicase DHX30 [Symbiodinium microadriaticum]|uniref:Putative ATP-dependent RNA helicase DHX30 n=1 Tax=Symbiodinium microadriaticum TaxID=2951 RepID=A0A1Q9EIH1_SYMMI|nr:putative ATP-dependent RNA helicase DHX30 [Symbiodinium microadriaticum]CAE7939734.1 DHX30 [Symbiodinium sp. KB8]